MAEAFLTNTREISFGECEGCEEHPEESTKLIRINNQRYETKNTKLSPSSHKDKIEKVLRALRTTKHI